jgi:riboflavin-specific deaminase-like protein
VDRRFPDVADESLDDAYSDLDPGVGGPWVAVSMVASVDGAVTLEGRSGGLGGEGDRVVFRALRDVADVVLVGAGTVRVEGYGPPRHRRPAAVARRRARGQQDRPAIAVVSRSLDLRGADRLLEGAQEAAVVVLTSADADQDRARDLRERGIEVVAAGDHDVDLDRAVDLLHDRGWMRVLCEGGPRLNGQLLAAGRVDEIFVTVAPVVVGGAAGRIVTGDLPVPLPLDLVAVRHHDGELYLRYRRGHDRQR